VCQNTLRHHFQNEEDKEFQAYLPGYKNGAEHEALKCLSGPESRSFLLSDANLGPY
jgi:hypothetical protein